MDKPPTCDKLSSASQEDKICASNIRAHGVFYTYPVDLINPIFTGIYLWKVSIKDLSNDYQVFQHHLMKSGLIMYGTKAYIFTQITNKNDIKSCLKKLFRGRKFRNNVTHYKATKLLVNKVRSSSSRTNIPLKATIQENLQHIMGVSDFSYFLIESMCLCTRLTTRYHCSKNRN